MTTTQEMLDHLSAKQQVVNTAINTVVEVKRNGAKYVAAEKTDLVDEVKDAYASCAVCRAWDADD